MASARQSGQAGRKGAHGLVPCNCTRLCSSKRHTHLQQGNAFAHSIDVLAGQLGRDLLSPAIRQLVADRSNRQHNWQWDIKAGKALCESFAQSVLVPGSTVAV